MLGYIIVAILFFVFGMITWALFGSFFKKEEELTAQEIEKLESLLENDLISIRDKAKRIIQIFKD